MHTTSNNLSVLYVLKNHRHHTNDKTTPPALLFLARIYSQNMQIIFLRIERDFPIYRMTLRVSCLVAIDFILL